MTIRRMTVGLLCVCSTSLAWARTGTVSVEKDGETFNVTFANHVHETNGLWVVYGAADKGSSTNGWEHVSFLGTVTPATNDWQYAVPTGWGDTVKAIRFILSEVPYDVDYTIEYVAADQVKDSTNKAQGIPITGFKLKGSDSVYVKFALNYISTTHNQTIFTTRNEAGTAPNIVLFWLSSKKFRYDYNASNASSVNSYEDASAVHEVVLDNSYMTIDGSEKVARPSTLFTGEATSDLMLLLGKPTSISNEGCGRIYALKVFDKDGALRLDLVPMVKGGKPGVYDRVNRNYYYSSAATENHLPVDAGPRVESENPYFASALCKATVTGPEVFMPETFTEDPTSYTNAYGGILNGSSALKLTGTNDWGGTFTVSNGTLIAEFGRGLGPNDRLVLSDLGSYGGWNGVVTNTVGNGPGQISPEGQNPYLSFTAVEGDLHVNLGGQGDPWVLTDELRRLRLNQSPVGGIVYFENPIHAAIDYYQFILRNATGESVLTQPYIVGDVLGAQTFEVHGDTATPPKGNTTTTASTNSYAQFTIKDGGWTFGANTTNTISGQLTVDGGLLVATNAVIVQTGLSTNFVPQAFVKGEARFVGGSYTTGLLTIGGTDNEPQSGKVEVDGTVVVKRIEYRPDVLTTGTPVIRSQAAGSALTLNEHADMTVQNFRFQRRNIFQYGGRLHLNGGVGILDMGKGGTTRYQLLGGRVEAPCFVQYTEDGKDHVAQMYFAGGTFAVTSAGENGVLFRDFGALSTVCINGGKGGTIETAYDVSITNVIHRSKDIDFNDNWNYTAEKYMTAPAFSKTGSGTLMLTETNGYICATDVAAGALKLASGAALPESGVVRLTGGTLDLGGNAQPLKALCGTAGEVKNGSVTVSEGIYPGGAGTIGSFTCNAALAGTLFIDVDATGAADSILTTTALDLSNIDLVITAPATAPVVPRRLKIVNGPHTGTFKSVSGLPAGWTLRYSDGRVSIGPDRGVVLFFR